MTDRPNSPFRHADLRRAPEWLPWQYEAWHHLTQLRPQYAALADDAPTWDELVDRLPPAEAVWLALREPI